MIWPRLSITVFLLSYCVTASLFGVRWWYWNIYQFVIGYAFRPHLSPDLPWEDKPSPGNLRLSTARFLALLSLLMPAFSLDYSPPPLTIWLLPVIIAPLPIELNSIPKLRCKSLAPLNFPRTITRPVSYYALF